VDANDVDPAGTITYAPPFDRPYDWTVSGDPELQSRLFSFFVSDEGLEEISTYADGIGPWKPYIVSSRAIALNPDGTVADANGDGLVNETDRELLPPTDLVERAHDHDLLIHTWTFRNEQRRLASDYEGNPINEYLLFYALGVDGVFSDFPDTAFTARELFRLERDHG
jgi:glycerophosphoryl diester phosphodiesterase